MEIKQVFIKSHDNDFWSYYKGALFAIFYYVEYTQRDWDNINEEKIQIFVQDYLNALYKLTGGNNEFPWKVKVYLNEKAREVFQKVSEEGGNSENAYMDIENYIITPNAKIENYIYTI